MTERIRLASTVAQVFRLGFFAGETVCRELIGDG